MKVLSTDGLTKLIQLIKSSFISVDDTVSTNTVTLATVATSGNFNDLINKPSEITVDSALNSTSTNPVENRVIAQALEGISLAKNPNLNLIGGSLNIDSGNVSGFSTTDYMQFPFVFNFNSYHWTLEMGFTTGSAVTTQQNLIDSYYGIAFAIRNGKFVLAISSNGSSWDIANTEGTYSVQANTAYSVKIAWDGTNYTLSYALDETNYTTDITVASALVHHSTQEYVGGEPDLYGDNSQHPFGGTINLNNWKLIVNGLEVWLGMDDVGLGSRANIDLSNLTEAGQYMVDTVKDQNGGSRIKTWTGTKAEYDAIGTTTTTVNYYGWQGQDLLPLPGEDTKYYATTSEVPQVGDTIYEVNVTQGTVTATDRTVASYDPETIAFPLTDNLEDEYNRYTEGDFTDTQTVVDPTAYDSNTLYNITDDADVTFQLLELIYPIGSIYIGTMSVCPLQTLGLGTWELKAQDMVLQGAGTKGAVKTELPQNVKLPNITGDVGYTIGNNANATGAFTKDANSNSAWWSGATNVARASIFHLNASRSSSVYSGDGTDTEIQQSAYLVNIWERIS